MASQISLAVERNKYVWLISGYMECSSQDMTMEFSSSHNWYRGSLELGLDQTLPWVTNLGGHFVYTSSLNLPYTNAFFTSNWCRLHSKLTTKEIIICIELRWATKESQNSSSHKFEYTPWQLSLQLFYSPIWMIFNSENLAATYNILSSRQIKELPCTLI